MPIGSEPDKDIIRPKHHKIVPGLGVFIARLFYVLPELMLSKTARHVSPLTNR